MGAGIGNREWVECTVEPEYEAQPEKKESSGMTIEEQNSAEKEQFSIAILPRTEIVAAYKALHEAGNSEILSPDEAESFFNAEIENIRQTLRASKSPR